MAQILPVRGAQSMHSLVYAQKKSIPNAIIDEQQYGQCVYQLETTFDDQVHTSTIERRSRRPTGGDVFYQMSAIANAHIDCNNRRLSILVADIKSVRMQRSTLATFATDTRQHSLSRRSMRNINDYNVDNSASNADFIAIDNRRRATPAQQLASRRHTRTLSCAGALRAAQSEKNLTTHDTEHSTPYYTTHAIHGVKMAAKDPITGESTTSLSDEEVYQIQLMYSARSTKVAVCSCLVNLYFTSKKNAKQAKKKDWELFATGVPVLLLDNSNLLHPSLNVVLAERGTGFTLWRDAIELTSDYTESGRTFHTMQTTNQAQIAGFAFDSSYAAMSFNQNLQAYLKEKTGALMRSMGEKGNMKRRNTSASKRHSAIILRKSDISTPCCFNHVTSLKAHDVIVPQQMKQKSKLSQSSTVLYVKSPTTSTLPNSTATSPTSSMSPSNETSSTSSVTQPKQYLYIDHTQKLLNVQAQNQQLSTFHKQTIA